jgi:hypothetical protein
MPCPGVLSQLSCTCCHVLTSHLPWPFQAVLFRLSASAVLSWLFCRGCLVMAFLPWMFCPGCSVPAVWSLLSCSSLAGLSVLSRLTWPAMLHQMSFLGLTVAAVPPDCPVSVYCTVQVVLFLRSCTIPVVLSGCPVLAVLPRLSCTSCPALVKFVTVRKLFCETQNLSENKKWTLWCIAGNRTWLYRLP